MNFRPKIIFFDIDDTLYLNSRQCVPASTRTALLALQRQGITAAIATGRTESVLPEAVRSLIDECGIRCIVSINGQYISLNGRELVSFPMPKAQIERIASTLSRNGTAYAFVSEQGLFTANDSSLSQHALGALRLPYRSDPAAYLHRNTYQMLGFYPESQAGHIQRLLPENVKTVRWHRYGVDILDKSGSKARGIQAALNALGLKTEDAAAFGDGMNDMEMLQTVGFGIAVGNAAEALKTVADYVCPPIEADGIKCCLKTLGWID